MNERLFDDPLSAWEPYQPTLEEPWDAARVAHLHRRAGLGANWGQVERDVKDGFEPSLRRILEGESHGPGGQPAVGFRRHRGRHGGVGTSAGRPWSGYRCSGSTV